LAADFKAAAAWDHDIEQEKYRRLFARQGQHLVAGNSDAYGESCQLQMVAHQVADVGIIFKDDYILLHQIVGAFA
jgi:hypothetical protein